MWFFWCILGPWATANYCRAGLKSLRGTGIDTKNVYKEDLESSGEWKHGKKRKGRGEDSGRMWRGLESRSMEGRGKDGEWKHGRKRKGWRVDTGRIWRKAEAWKEEERKKSGCMQDLK